MTETTTAPVKDDRELLREELKAFEERLERGIDRLMFTMSLSRMEAKLDAHLARTEGKS